MTRTRCWSCLVWTSNRAQKQSGTGPRMKYTLSSLGLKKSLPTSWRLLDLTKSKRNTSSPFLLGIFTNSKFQTAISQRIKKLSCLRFFSRKTMKSIRSSSKNMKSTSKAKLSQRSSQHTRMRKKERICSNSMISTPGGLRPASNHNLWNSTSSKSETFIIMLTLSKRASEKRAPPNKVIHTVLWSPLRDQLRTQRTCSPSGVPSPKPTWQKYSTWPSTETTTTQRRIDPNWDLEATTARWLWS